MKKKLIFAVAVVAVLVSVILGYAATRSDIFRVQRSITINAPPEEIFVLIEDFHRWRDWSPYEKLDPNLARAYRGATSGTGAIYAWEGNGQVGQGSMEITDATAPERVAIKLDFVRPFRCNNVALFTLKGQGEATQVTWAMEGPQPFCGKVVGLFINMDEMVGGQFEEGLANLKRQVEQSADAPATLASH